MRRFGMFEYSCLLWAINVILNVLSYSVIGMKYTAPFLLLAAFASCFVMLITARKEQVDMTTVWRKSARWADIIALVSFAYVAVNFVVCMFLLREGGPHIDNGVYCLWNHGFIREITKEEYDALMLVEGRFFTGHILVFSALPVVFFSARKNCASK